MNKVDIINKATDVLTQIQLQGSLLELMNGGVIEEKITHVKNKLTNVEETYRLIMIKTGKGQMVLTRRINDVGEYKLTLFSNTKKVFNIEMGMESPNDSSKELYNASIKYQRAVKAFMSEFYKLSNEMNISIADDVLDSIIDIL